MPAPTTTLSAKQLIEAAKAPLLAYNDKDWGALQASIAPNFVYDEVGTERKVQGVDAVVALFKEWAEAIPDSTAMIHNANVSGNTVVIEVTWNGTHTGPLNLPQGPVPGTGKSFEVRACNVFEFKGDKPSVQRQYFDMGTILRQLGI